MRLVAKTIDQAREVAAEIARQFAKHPEGLLVVVEPYRHPRTNSQNAKIHVLVSQLADGLGYDKDDLKEVLKMKYWPTKVVSLRKGDVVIPKATSALSREEASIVIERLLHLAAETNVAVDQP